MSFHIVYSSKILLKLVILTVIFKGKNRIECTLIGLKTISREFYSGKDGIALP